MTTQKATNITWHNGAIARDDRERLLQQKGAVIWFTGLPASGKSTLAHAVEEKLFEKGFLSYVLDGDNVRHGLNKNLGFSPEDREENIRRIGEVCADHRRRTPKCDCRNSRKTNIPNRINVVTRIVPRPRIGAELIAVARRCHIRHVRIGKSVPVVPVSVRIIRETNASAEEIDHHARAPNTVARILAAPLRLAVRKTQILEVHNHLAKRHRTRHQAQNR